MKPYARSSWWVVVALAAAACDSPPIAPDASTPAAIPIISGDRQSTVVGTELALPLVAKVLDAKGRGLRDQRVSFTVMAGGGAVTPSTVLSDEQGVVAARWTLGPSTAESQSVEARTPASTSGSSLAVVFRATALAGPPATVTMIAGDGQSAEAGASLGDSLAVKVLDRLGNPVSDRVVTWSVVTGGGTLAPATPTTDVQGVAKARWTLGTSVAESQRVEARLASGAADSAFRVVFDATALAGPPTTLRRVAGDGQSVEAGGSPDSLVVKVLDRFDNPVSNVVVNWSVVSGGGTLAPSATTTDGQGVAKARWALPVVGENTARASVSGLAPVTFGVTVTTVVGMPFASISAGYFRSCGVATSGAAYCWGTTPTAVAGGLAFTSVSVGVVHTCGVTTDRRAYCWGEGYGSTPVRVDGGVEFVEVTVGHRHTCGLTAGGAAYCWGDNWLGALGTGDRTDRSTPTPVIGGLTFQSLSAGWFYTCGVTTAGVGYCWGVDAALGSAAATVLCDDNEAVPEWCVTSPAQVDSGHTFTRIATGDRLTCALTVGGAAHCWKGYHWGQDQGPVAVPGGLTFASLDVDGGSSCGVTSGGRVFCWGWIPVPNVSSNAPILLGGDVTFATVSVGWWHSCGVSTSGVAYCWGRNGSGELGDGSHVDSASPVRVAARP